MQNCWVLLEFSVNLPDYPYYNTIHILHRTKIRHRELNSPISYSYLWGNIDSNSSLPGSSTHSYKDKTILSQISFWGYFNVTISEKLNLIKTIPLNLSFITDQVSYMILSCTTLELNKFKTRNHFSRVETDFYFPNMLHKSLYFWKIGTLNIRITPSSIKCSFYKN